ncbi:MAG: hypothetical protein L6Q54_02850 [Leptospiraceae bacterium]|nr:hypothetical protein [Leptospiraceae bacterium]MCK6380174.1 hypothetical protein [Leptospiraceae bacterium]NUM41204.1 hypothetical protein [Leptospiraceae bacterium]
MLLVIFLAQERTGLQWPEVSGSTVFTIIASVSIVALLIYFINSVKGKFQKGDSDWERIHIHALNKGFSQKEISILQGFYQRLNIVEKESFDLEKNKKGSYYLLYTFFLNKDLIPIEERVKILGSLFFERKTDSLPHSTLDLKIGEVCSLEISSKKYLTFVIKKSETEILLKNHKWLSDGKGLSLPASVFCFRSGFGGIVFTGQVVSVSPEGILFHYSGNMRRKGGEKSASTIELSIELKTKSFVKREKGREEDSILLDDIVNKSLDEIDEILGNKPSKDKKEKSESKRIETVVEEIYKKAVTEKISDKFIQFRLEGNITDEILRRNEVWEVKMIFPTGVLFQAKGNIVPVPNSDDIFIFKYLSLDEKSRKELISEVQRLGANQD